METLFQERGGPDRDAGTTRRRGIALVTIAASSLL